MNSFILKSEYLAIKVEGVLSILSRKFSCAFQFILFELVNIKFSDSLIQPRLRLQYYGSHQDERLKL